MLHRQRHFRLCYWLDKSRHSLGQQTERNHRSNRHEWEETPSSSKSCWPSHKDYHWCWTKVTLKESVISWKWTPNMYRTATDCGFMEPQKWIRRDCKGHLVPTHSTILILRLMCPFLPHLYINQSSDDSSIANTLWNLAISVGFRAWTSHLPFLKFAGAPHRFEK